MTFTKIPTWTEWQTASASSMTIRSLKPKLVRIDDLIKKYHHVLDMGRLNILMELRVAIIDWMADKIDRDASTGRKEAMRALQEIVLHQLTELDNWGKHRYLKAVCIGYEIRTGQYDPNKKPISMKQRDIDEKAEFRARVAQLKKAIAKARAKYQAHVVSTGLALDEDQKILKIFMAPEFFFRGPYGAYRDVGYVSEILDLMRGETGTAQYSDWLFVHGSVITTSEKMVNGKSDGVLLENFAVVQKGGPRTTDLQDFIVAKEYPSHVDFEHPSSSDWEWYKTKKPATAIAGKDRSAIFPEGGRKDTLNPIKGTTKVSELVGGCIFTMDSITFGLEVCRDHYLRRLASSKEAKSAQIQLIPSCGMDIEAEAIACRPKGIVFNVDGSAPHVHVQTNSNDVAPGEIGPCTSSGGGNIRIFTPAKIPWPIVRKDVAKELQVSRLALMGKAPAPPPIPAFLKGK